MTLSKQEVQRGGAHFKTIIPEGDVYRLIARSNLPTAQAFEEWMMDEPSTCPVNSAGQVTDERGTVR
jgi:prophage antirepressor-like protein